MALEQSLKTLETAYQMILDYFNRDNSLTQSEKDNFKDTATRAAKALQEMTLSNSEIAAKLTDIINTHFPLEEDAVCDMITQGPVKVQSFCPHHLLSVEYHGYVSYIPKHGKCVLGLSKLARIAKTLGARPIIQEQLANDIANTLFNDGKPTRFPSISSLGCAVMLIGKHHCMSGRGVCDTAATIVTTVRGCYKVADTEQKFYKMVDNLKRFQI